MTRVVVQDILSQVNEKFSSENGSSIKGMAPGRTCINVKSVVAI